MKRTCIVFLIAAVSFCAALRNGPADAGSETVFQSGAWLGYANSDDATGEFNHCGILSESGTSVFGIAIGADLSLLLLLEDSAWDLGAGSDYTVTLQVDNRGSRQVTGYGEGVQIAFNLGHDFDFLKDLRGGYTLHVRSAHPLQYSLAGTSVAIQKAVQCALTRTRTAENRNPFGEGAATNAHSGDAAGGLSGDEAANLQTVLLAAGFENVQMETGLDVQARMGEDTLATWTAGEGIAGFFMISDFDGSTEVRPLMSYLLGDLAGDCEGQLAIAQDEPVVTDIDTIIRGSVACLTPSEIYYYDALVSFGSIELFMIVHISDEKSHSDVSAATLELVEIFKR